MNYDYALGQCTNYLLDILDVPPGPLPDRAQGHWDDVFKLALDQRIYHYLAAWMLEYWNEGLPEKLKEKLRYDLEWNKARNIKLSMEIVELANMFREAGIPAMFLKGAAGLVRGLYPLAWRFISDIDVMVKEDQIEIGHNLLLSRGYTSKHLNSIRSHHFGPYSVSKNIGEVELHIDPYQFNFFSRNETKEYWNNTCDVLYYNEYVTVPSLHDNIWILTRTDLLARVCIPRLKDSIELSLIFDKGFNVDYNSLCKRASSNNIPNVVGGLWYSFLRFINVMPNSNITLEHDSLIKKWEVWSCEYRKKHLYDDDQIYNCQKDFAALRYYTSGSIRYKTLFLIWLLRYNSRKYCYTLLKKCGLYPFARKVKHLISN
jgi:hypothetical protein